MKKIRIPEIGEVLPHFGGGKFNPAGRFYLATIINKITLEEAKNIIIHRSSITTSEPYDLSLYDFWVYNKTMNWLFIFADNTDFIIQAKVEDEIVYYARAEGNGWFSMKITNYLLQEGELDVDLTLFEQWKSDESKKQYYKDRLITQPQITVEFLEKNSFEKSVISDDSSPWYFTTKDYEICINLSYENGPRIGISNYLTGKHLSLEYENSDRPLLVDLRQMLNNMGIIDKFNYGQQ